MIMYDTPACGEPTENQSKDSTDISLRSFQMPVTQHQGRLRTQSANFQARKPQFSHCLSVGVGALIAFQQATITPYNPIASCEGDFCGVPIAVQESRNIASIPRGLLSRQHSLDSCREGSACELPGVCPALADSGFRAALVAKLARMAANPTTISRRRTKVVLVLLVSLMSCLLSMRHVPRRIVFNRLAPKGPV